MPSARTLANDRPRMRLAPHAHLASRKTRVQLRIEESRERGTVQRSNAARDPAWDAAPRTTFDTITGWDNVRFGKANITERLRRLFPGPAGGSSEGGVECVPERYVTRGPGQPLTNLACHVAIPDVGRRMCKTL